MTWYAEWPGVALAVAGIALATGPAFARDRGAVLFLPVAVLLGTLAIYGVDARVQTDHFWAVRRLVSSVLPLLAVFAGVAVAYLWAGRRLRAVAVVALAATAVLEAIDLRPALRFDEYRGSTRQLAALDRLLGPANTLVITPWLNAPDGRYGVPLRVRFHRTAVPVIHPELDPLASWVRDQVSQRPVRVVALFGRLPTLPPRRERGARVGRSRSTCRSTIDRRTDTARQPPAADPAGRVPAGAHRPVAPRGFAPADDRVRPQGRFGRTGGHLASAHAHSSRRSATAADPVIRTVSPRSDSAAGSRSTPPDSRCRAAARSASSGPTAPGRRR